MPRYFTRSAWVGDDPWGDRPNYHFDETPVRELTVFEREGGPEDSGLLDANGKRLYRVSDRQPLGFDLTARLMSKKRKGGKRY